MASQASEQVVPVPDSKTKTIQYGLAKWLGTSSQQKKEAAPVLGDVDLASKTLHRRGFFEEKLCGRVEMHLQTDLRQKQNCR